MAAITIAALTGVHNSKVTLSGTPNTMQEIQVPSNTRMIEVYFVDAAGVVVHNGGTDAAVISSETGFPVGANISYYWNVPASRKAHSIWVASGSASTVCHFAIYEA
tara:strand:- start:619 stop:936 length:318 start_codon:yes stop_codon:yes gene_type:complete